MPPLHRLFRVLAAAALGLALSASASTPFFQPLHEPATGEQHPGKFIWADLFTANPAAATKFYSGLFSWTANVIEQDGRSYTVFSNGKRPVAGLTSRHSGDLKRPSRWIGYIAVNDLPATLALVTKAGGQVRAPARAFPDRGSQAIITDAEDSPVGLLQSGSGDTPDSEPQPGDFNWFELYAHKPPDACGFYSQVFGYVAAADTRTARKDDFLLSSGDVPRGGVAPLPDRDDAKPGWLCVVRVENIDESLKRVILLGGEVLVAPRSFAYGSRFSIIADSTGGTIGLVEYVDNANPATRP